MIPCSWLTLVTLIVAFISKLTVNLENILESDMWHNLLSLQLLLLALIAWQDQCNADCCYSTTITFSLKDSTKQQCTDFPGGKKTIVSKLECKTKLCGNLDVPTPYCGVGSCNVFGCKCKDGCLGEKGKTALEAFQKQYGKQLGIIK